VILNQLRKASLDSPYRPCIVVMREQSIWQFNARDCWIEIERWAGRFAALNIEPRSVVFFILKHRWEQYFAFLGAMRAGLVPSYLPFATPKQDAALYWASHRDLFKRIRPAALITYDENVGCLQDAVKTIDVPVFSVDELTTLSPAELPPLPKNLEEVAFLQFSSGTTGLKKGVQITHRQLQEQVASYSGMLGLGAGDGIATWLPLYHDMGLVATFLMPIYVGATIVSIDAFEWVSRPMILLNAIENFRATFAWLPNFAFAHIARTAPDDAQPDLSSLRALINCSEPCKPAAFESFLSRFGKNGVDRSKLQTCYAMAETVFAVSQSPPDSVVRQLCADGVELAKSGKVALVKHTSTRAQEFLSCGSVIPGLNVRIGNGYEEGRAGEIQISGSFVFSGYYRNPEASREAFDGQWYKTGDIGFFYEGELYICGRHKETLIVHGRNYYANDIEHSLNEVRGVKPGRAVAFALFDQMTQSEEAIALVETDPLNLVEPIELRRAAKKAVYDRLELTLRSVEILAPDTLVKTTSGKLSRHENRKRYLERRKSSGHG
jgi:acyl-CoA synthetase (AMP-forming)/AMP-acid ligase II